jgi:hypothetical protein
MSAFRGVHGAGRRSQTTNSHRGRRDTENLCVSVSLWLPPLCALRNALPSPDAADSGRKSVTIGSRTDSRYDAVTQLNYPRSELTREFFVVCGENERPSMPE